MKRVRSFGAILLVFGTCAVTASAYPGGGGGIEYYTNIETSALTRLGLPTGSLLNFPRGTVYGVGGFGYVIDRYGWKFGGFGMALFTNGMTLALPDPNGTVTGAIGGIGGFISGGHGRIGPIDLSVNCRLGVAGIAITESVTSSTFGPYTTTDGVAALYGSLEAELGVHLFRNMMVSGFAGVDALVPIVYGIGPGVLPAPVSGIRLTWGSF